MKTTARPLECFIGSFNRPRQESYLDENGFSRGMIIFAIPSHGILFKCRAAGSLVDLEFGALFALLRFIKTSLAKEKIKAVSIHSSNPEFVFAIANKGDVVRKKPQRAKMLKEYLQQFKLQIALVPPQKNKTGVAPGDFPSTPADQVPPLKPKSGDRSKVRFKPIQKGLSL